LESCHGKLNLIDKFSVYIFPTLKVRIFCGNIHYLWSNSDFWIFRNSYVYRFNVDFYICYWPAQIYSACSPGLRPLVTSAGLSWSSAFDITINWTVFELFEKRQNYFHFYLSKYIKIVRYTETHTEKTSEANLNCFYRT